MTRDAQKHLQPNDVVFPPPSNARQTRRPPRRIDPTQLRERQEGGRNMVGVDTRAHDEFVRKTSPGGISVPGGELAHGLAELAPEPGAAGSW